MNSKRNLKMFPWMQCLNSHVHTACFSENASLHEDVIQCLYREVSSEILNIVTEKNFERAEKLCEVLSAYISYFHRSNITFNKELAVPSKSFIMLMSCLVDLHIFLCTGDSSSFHLKNCISNLFLFIGTDVYSLWDVLLYCKLLKKKHSAALLPVMKRVMQGVPETISNAADYMKMILLMRHWKIFSELKEDKYEILSLALKVKPPDDLLHWLSKLRIKGLHELPFSSAGKMVARHFLCKQFPKGFFKELQKVLCNKALDVSNVHSSTDEDLSSCNWNPGPSALFFVDKGQPSSGGNSLEPGGFLVDSSGLYSLEPRGFLVDSSGLDSFRGNQIEEPGITGLEAKSTKKKSRKKHKGLQNEDFLSHFSVAVHSDSEEQAGLIKGNPADKSFSKVGGKSARKKATSLHSSFSENCILIPDPSTETEERSVESDHANLVCKFPVTESPTHHKRSKEMSPQTSSVSVMHKISKLRNKAAALKNNESVETSLNEVEMEATVGNFGENKTSPNCNVVCFSKSLCCNENLDQQFAKSSKSKKKKLKQNVIEEEILPESGNKVNKGCALKNSEDNVLLDESHVTLSKHVKKARRSLQKNSRVSLQLADSSSFEVVSQVHDDDGSMKGTEGTSETQKHGEDFDHITGEAYFVPSHSVGSPVCVNKSSPVVTSKKKKNRKKEYLSRDHVSSEGSNIPLNLQVGDDIDIVCHSLETKEIEMAQNGELLISPKCNSFHINSPSGKEEKHIHKKKKGSYLFSETSDTSEVTPKKNAKECNSKSFRVLSNPGDNEFCKRNKTSDFGVAARLQRDNLNAVPSSGSVFGKKERNVKDESNSNRSEDTESVCMKSDYQDGVSNMAFVQNSPGMKHVSPSKGIALQGSFENYGERLSSSAGISPKENDQTKTSRKKKKSNLEDSICLENVHVEKDCNSCLSEHRLIDASHSKSKRCGKRGREKFSEERFSFETVDDEEIYDTVHRKKKMKISPEQSENLCASPILNPARENERPLSLSNEISDDGIEVPNANIKESFDSTQKKKKKKNSLLSKSRDLSLTNEIHDDEINTMTANTEESFDTVPKKNLSFGLSGSFHTTPVVNATEENESSVSLSNEISDKSKVLSGETSLYNNECPKNSSFADDDLKITDKSEISKKKSGKGKNKDRHYNSPSAVVEKHCTESSAVSVLSDPAKTLPDAHEKSFSFDSVSMPNRKEQMEQTVSGSELNILFVNESADEKEFPKSPLAICASPNKSNLKSKGSLPQNEKNELSTLAKTSKFVEPFKAVGDHDKIDTDKSSLLLGTLDSPNTPVTNTITNNSPISQKSPSKRGTLHAVKSNEEDELFSDSSCGSQDLERSLLSRINNKTECPKNTSRILSEKASDKCKSVSPGNKASPHQDDFVLFLESSSEDEDNLPEMSPKKSDQLKVSDSFLSHHVAEQKKIETVEENGSIVFETSKDSADVSDLNLFEAWENEKNFLIPEIDSFDVTDNRSYCNNELPILAASSSNQQIIRSRSMPITEDPKCRPYSMEDSLSISSPKTPKASEDFNNVGKPSEKSDLISKKHFRIADTLLLESTPRSSNKCTSQEHIISEAMLSQHSNREEILTGNQQTPRSNKNSISNASHQGCDVADKLVSHSNSVCINDGNNNEGSGEVISSGDDSEINCSPAVPSCRTSVEQVEAVKCSSARKAEHISKTPCENTLHSDNTEAGKQPSQAAEELVNAVICNRDSSVLTSSVTSSPMKHSVSRPNHSSKMCLHVELDSNSAKEYASSLSPTKKSSNVTLSCSDESLSPSASYQVSSMLKLCKTDDHSIVNKENSALEASPRSKSPQKEDCESSPLRHSPRIKQKLLSSHDKNKSVDLKTSPRSKHLERDYCASPVRCFPRIKREQLSLRPFLKRLSPRNNMNSSKSFLSESSSMMDSKNHLDFSDLKNSPQHLTKKSPSSSLKAGKDVESNSDSEENVIEQNGTKPFIKSSPPKNIKLPPSPWKSRLRTPARTKVENSSRRKSPPSRNPVSSGVTEAAHDDYSLNEGESDLPIWKSATKSDRLFPPEPKQYSGKKKSSLNGSTALLDQSLKDLCLRSPGSNVVSKVDTKPSPGKTPNHPSFGDSVTPYASKTPFVGESSLSVKRKAVNRTVDACESLSTRKGPSRVRDSVKEVPLKSFNEKISSSCSKLKTRQSEKNETAEQIKDRGYNLRSRNPLIIPSKLNV